MAQKEITLERISHLFSIGETGEIYCKVCSKFINELETEELSIMGHQISGDHLLSLINYTIDKFQKMGLKTKQHQEVERVILFDLDIAQIHAKGSSDKLKQYFQNCIEELEGFLENCKASTQTNYILVIRRFYKYLLNNGINYLDVEWIRKYFFEQDKFKDFQVLKKLIKYLKPQGFEALLNEMNQATTQQQIKEPNILRFQDCFLKLIAILKKEKLIAEMLLYLLAYSGVSLKTITQINISQILLESKEIFRQKNDPACVQIRNLVQQNLKFFESRFNGNIVNPQLSYEQLGMQLKEMRIKLRDKADSTEFQEFLNKATLTYVQKMRLRGDNNLKQEQFSADGLQTKQQTKTNFNYQNNLNKSFQLQEKVFQKTKSLRERMLKSYQYQEDSSSDEETKESQKKQALKKDRRTYNQVMNLDKSNLKVEQGIIKNKKKQQEKFHKNDEDDSVVVEILSN